MKIAKFSLIIFVIFKFSFSLADSSWSVQKEDMTRYFQKCSNLPSVPQMEAYLRKRLSEDAQVDSTFGALGEILGSVKSYFTGKFPPNQFNIDGFKVEGLNEKELSLLLRLTSHFDEYYYEYLFKDDYKQVRKHVGDKLTIKRTCVSKICKERKKQGYSEIYNLGTVKNQKPYCKDLLCATKRIFGSPKGIYILFAMEKYGLQLGKYSSANADPEGFSEESLKAIIRAAEAMPEHLRERALEDATFYQFLKGFTLRSNSPYTVANAAGNVYDAINDYEEEMRVFVFSHEFGHRTATIDDPLDENPLWADAAGFDVVDTGNAYKKSYVAKTGRKSISEYGLTNIYEDYAETYSMYRFSPDKLKNISPKRYSFFKKYVFKGIEYTKDYCNGSKLASRVQPKSKAIKGNQ